MAVATQQAPPTKRAPRSASEPTPTQRLELKSADYIILEDQKRRLQAEVKAIEGGQAGLRADILDVLEKHPDVLNGKKSVALEKATLTLRTSQKLVEALIGYSEIGRDAILKRFKVDAWELRFNAAVVIKAAAASKALNDALLTTGCEVRDVVSLTITPAKHDTE